MKLIVDIDLVVGLLLQVSQLDLKIGFPLAGVPFKVLEIVFVCFCLYIT